MEKYCEIINGDLKLRGIVHKPEGKKQFPCVIMLHGFTSNRMEFGSTFVKLSRMLEKLGICSVRFDFSGCGESDGNFVDMTISEEVSEAMVILNYIKKLKFVDPTHIGVLGMSLGGVVASLLCGRREKEIQALSLWSPAAIVPEHIRNGRIQDVIIPENMNQFEYIDFHGIKVGINFVRDALNIDIFEVASHFKQQVLLIHGTKDEIVPIKVTEKYHEKYGNTSKFIKVEGAGHSYESVEYRQFLLEETVQFFCGCLLK